MAVILDVFVKKFKSSSEGSSDTILVQIHSEGLANCHFHCFADSIRAVDGHLGLLGRINLKGLYLEIILTEAD